MAPIEASAGEPSKASFWPVVVTAFILLASIAIQVFQFQLANNIWYYVGYILTPLLATMGLAWDTLAQRRGQKSPWFESKPVYSKVLRALVAVGFVVAVFHIVAIGTQLGELVVQSGASQ
jgi:hypothetical protein